ncbi:hypothetical protein SKAU_G00221010 [Synaphobranchus kaupii]|uniref:UPAR/Ly6 domain-containing protein n=1 Tax=Synaphobranchus kaupii TaxID=118154 RepID=A0A9Q1FAM7_SYNKA|nr:hypothetical protein SKAU_G00221010 [Synaphobranchus kaupii]
MNRVLCCLLAVAVLFVVVESLTCRTCRAAFLGECLIPANITCSVAQSNCFVGEAVFVGIPNFIGFKTHGCLDTASCNRTETGTILGVPYNSTFYCCSTDLCVPGGASTVQLSLTAGAALLFSLWNSMGC